MAAVKQTIDQVETLAVEKLRGSGLWQSVADSTSPFPSDYILLVNVRRFEADYTGGGVAPDVHVVLDCIVGRREEREVVWLMLDASVELWAGAEGKAPLDAAVEECATLAVRHLARGDPRGTAR